MPRMRTRRDRSGSAKNAPGAQRRTAWSRAGRQGGISKAESEAGRAAERKPAGVPAQRQAQKARLRENQQSRVVPGSPETRATAEGERAGGEGGTSQRNCEKWGQVSPLQSMAMWSLHS